MNYPLIFVLTILFILIFNIGKYLGYREYLKKHKKMIKDVNKINALLDSVEKKYNKYTNKK